MNQDLQNAQLLLEENNHTCVLCRGETFYTSRERGVAPLLGWLDKGVNLAGFAAADRVIGKATAYLYCLLGVSCVYARVMSRPALQVLEAHRIPASWDTLVDAIENRQKTGLCPMEKATTHCTNAQDALLAIRQALAQLRQTP